MLVHKQFISYYEMQGHSDRQWDRCEEAVQLLDSLIRLLSLNNLDADRPEARYAIFATSARAMAEQSLFTDPTTTHTHPYPNVLPEGNGFSEMVGIPELNGPVEGPSRCACLKYTLKEQWPTVSEVAPLWEMTTMWPEGLHESEIRKEECRRLVWSSVMLSAGQNSYTAADGEIDRTELFIKDYRNVRAFTFSRVTAFMLTRLVHSSPYYSQGRCSPSRLTGNSCRVMCGICVSARWCCGTRACARGAILP